MPETITKTTRKRKIIRKKKRAAPRKVPKTDPKQQSVLKTLFVNQRTGTKKRSSGTRRPPSPPPSQQVWRRTVLRNKPKPKPKDKLPRLFRMDDQTGLPMDYERTVDRVMHYVNPHLTSRLNAEQELEELLTKSVMHMMRHCCPHEKGPAHMCCRDGKSPASMCCREQQTKRYLQTLLKAHPSQLDQFSEDERRRKSKQRANEDLTSFHSACKRGPRQISPNLGPTKASKFNFNQLRIRSQ